MAEVLLIRETRAHYSLYAALLLKSTLYKGKIGGITDPAELENAELHLFYLVHTETFPTKKVISPSSRHLAVSLKSLSFFPFLDQVVL